MYWDVYLIENLFLDGAMLVLTLFLMRKRIYFIRVLIAAVFGAVMSTVMLVVGMRFGISYIAILFAVGMVMMKLAMRQKKRNELVQGVVYYFTLVFAFSKLHQVSEWLVGSRVSGLLLVILEISIMGVVLLYMTYQSYRNRQKSIYFVKLTEQGKSLEVKALLDTGNALTEPISGKPVSVIEADLWRKIMAESKMEKFKIIPFHSIGKEHGILEGMEIDEMIICQDERRIVQKKAIIAFYEGKLSNDRHYQMILHQSLMT